jgi:hypothetical protein
MVTANVVRFKCWLRHSVYRWCAGCWPRSNPAISLFKPVQGVTACWSTRLNFLTDVASCKSHHPCTTYSCTNYTNKILDIGHWGIYDIPDVSAVGCTPVLRWSLVINRLFPPIFRHAEKELQFHLFLGLPAYLFPYGRYITSCSASRLELMPSKRFQLFLF